MATSKNAGHLLAVVLLLVGCDRGIEVERSTHASALHEVEITRFRLDLPGPPGGGIARLGGGYLAASGNSALYWFERSGVDGAELAVHELPHRVPVNRAEFLRWTEAHRDELAPFMDHAFRTNDLLLVPRGDQVRLLVSYTHWNEADTCYTLRVASALTSLEALRAPGELAWETFFASEPCLPMKTVGHSFAGQQAGGEMVLSPDATRVLLTVGDFEFDGLNDPLAVSQDRKNDYGKLLSIDVETGATEIVAWGLRNPQGIALDREQRIWTTEHGPQGGDELNLIVPGENYGWPYVTYGVQYGRFDWPLSIVQSDHTGFAAPIFAWVPSVGAADLLIHDGHGFDQWRGDLFVAALKPRHLLRLRVRDDRVAYIEPIPLDTRIRDMIEDEDGTLVLWTDNPDLRFVSPLDHEEALARAITAEERGRVLFTACQGCHPVIEGEPDGIGPNLFGIEGRALAASSNYPYSAALRSKGGTWTAGRLDAYLFDPQGFAPGTSMQYEGLRGPIDRASIVAYLRSLG